MSGQRGNLPHAVGGLSAHRDLGTYRLQGDSRCVRGRYKIRHTWERCRYSPCHSLGEVFHCSKGYAFHISTAQSRLLHNLVERCSHSDKFFSCHTTIWWRFMARCYFVSFHFQMLLGSKNVSYKNISDWRISCYANYSRIVNKVLWGLEFEGCYKLKAIINGRNSLIWFISSTFVV